MANLNWRRSGRSDLTMGDTCRQMAISCNSDFSKTSDRSSNHWIMAARGAIVELFFVACEERR